MLISIVFHLFCVPHLANFLFLMHVLQFYVFVRYENVDGHVKFEFSLCTWASKGGQGAWPLLDFEIFRKKGCFLSFQWKKSNLPLLYHPGKI